MLPQFPSNARSLKSLCVCHGVFTSDIDYATYARRLPENVREGLAQALVQAWRSDGICALRKLVAETPARFSFVGYCRLVFNLGGVIRSLAKEGIAPFGLGYPFPWDGVGHGEKPIMSSTLSQTLWYFLHHVAGLRESEANTRLTQGARDVMAELGGPDGLRVVCSSYEREFSNSNTTDLFEKICSLARQDIHATKVAPHVAAIRNPELLMIGIGAGTDYAPWELGDTSNLRLLVEIVCENKHALRVRDASIILQYVPAETAAEAINVILELCGCISRIGPDHASTLVFWSRVRQLADCWELLEIRRQMSFSEYEEYEANPIAAVRDSQRIQHRVR